MRDLLFKNLTSTDRRKKVIVSNELFEQSGIRTRIIRHLICRVNAVKPDSETKRPAPYLYVIKERNNKEGKERFFFRLKGSIYTTCNNQLYLITFLHSLKINVKVLTQGAMEV